MINVIEVEGKKYLLERVIKRLPEGYEFNTDFLHERDMEIFNHPEGYFMIGSLIEDATFSEIKNEVVLVK